jgi:Dolichyl-phosphate-mannose-protein mannosyltransferase
MAPEPDQIALGRLRVSRQAAFAALATAVFIALSIWWLLYDQRVPGGGDPGRHLALTETFAGWLDDGDFASFFDPGAKYSEEFFYPPLVHIVGSIPSALGLALQDWSVIAVNLVFVPMLAAGCFGVGRMTYGPTAGLLAVIFALGTPMVLSLFHVFLLDAPLAGSVAIALWALLASDRFSRRKESAIAGALVGLAVLVKTPAPLFLAGPIAVMLIAGGWRQWRNVLIAAGLALLVAGPYYVAHLDDLVGTSEATTIAGNTGGPAAGLNVDSRFSIDNLTYYGWVGINLQYFLPLLALLAAGLVAALREIRRRPYLPELVAGLVVGYLGPTLLLSIRDPRYTLPLVVYVAVLATGWIAVTRRAVLAGLGAAVLAGGVVLNLAAASVDDVANVAISLPGDSASPLDITQPGRLTVIDGRGYVVGPPRPDPLWDRMLTAAEREGLDSVRIRALETPMFGTDTLGFEVLARQYGVVGRSYSDMPRHPDLRINTWWTSDEFWVEQGLPVPCGTVEEGAVAPPGTDPVRLSVAVERLVDGRYERWCEF